MRAVPPAAGPHVKAPSLPRHRPQLLTAGLGARRQRAPGSWGPMGWLRGCCQELLLSRGQGTIFLAVDCGLITSRMSLADCHTPQSVFEQPRLTRPSLTTLLLSDLESIPGACTRGRKTQKLLGPDGMCRTRVETAGGS